MDNDIGETAVFFDFENIVLGVKDKFHPRLVLEHLSSRGNVLVRRAYADWGRYSRYQSPLLELGTEMVFLPTYGVADKNRTDTAVCVDAMEILFLRPNVETFVIVSGDSDFGVLARKLRGYGKRVMGISAKHSASKILASVCHEFIFYESLVGEKLQGYGASAGERLIRRVLPNILETQTTFQPSLLKDRLRKIDSTFSERNYGYTSFLKFIESYPKIFRVERFEGGRTQVSIRDDAEVGKTPPLPSKSEGRSSGSRDTSRSGSRPKVARAAAKPKEEVVKDAKASEALQACRDLLRVVMQGVGPNEEVTLNKLKARMVANVPTFDHRKLGYRSFTEFLRAQDDVVTVLRDGRRYRVRAAS
jgi:uncharacterized LabA/DUF88 family protein